jgi:hypothetical protein
MDGCYEWFCGSGEWAGLFVSIIVLRVAKRLENQGGFRGRGFQGRRFQCALGLQGLIDG